MIILMKLWVELYRIALSWTNLWQLQEAWSASGRCIAQVICWDRGRLARYVSQQRSRSKDLTNHFALRAHCGRVARGPGKSLDRHSAATLG